MTKPKSAQEMQDLTIAWAKKAGFFDTTTADIQLEKFMEEHEEVIYAAKGYYGELEPADLIDLAAITADSQMLSKDAKSFWLEKIKDGVGDSMVTYFIQCELRGLSPTAIKDTITMGAHIEAYSLTVDGLCSKLASLLRDLRNSVDLGYTTGCVAYSSSSTGIATWIGHMFGFTPEECFDHAYAIISKRLGKGKVIDGIFVKEEDLPDNEEDVCRQ